MSDSKLIGSPAIPGAPLVKGAQPTKKAPPLLVTPEDWRVYITQRVVGHVTERYPDATLQMSNIERGTYSQEVVDNTPVSCVSAIHTVENIICLDRTHLPPLFVRIPTGALTLAFMGWQENLDKGIEVNTNAALDAWAEVFSTLTEDQLSKLTRVTQ